MATVGGKKRLPSKVSLPRGNSNPYNVPLATVPVRRKTGEDVMGWIAACLLVAVFLPLFAMVYLDNLTIKARAEKAIEKLERIERRIEKKEREKRDEPKEFADNPIFDRRKKDE